LFTSTSSLPKRSVASAIACSAVPSTVTSAAGAATASDAKLIDGGILVDSNDLRAALYKQFRCCTSNAAGGASDNRNLSPDFVQGVLI